jgi:hypothetical protein
MPGVSYCNRLGVNMSDDEYSAFLRALAAKHRLGAARQESDAFSDWEWKAEITRTLHELSAAVRALKATINSYQDFDVIGTLIGSVWPPAGKVGHIDKGTLSAVADAAERITSSKPISIIRKSVDIMDEGRMLDALDDGREIVFKHLHRGVVPPEDVDLLRAAGFDDNEIEVLLALAMHKARDISVGPQSASGIANDVVKTAEIALAGLSTPKGPKESKKRKILNGIGKVLGGAVLGIGNVLLATGTVVAPNPATAYLSLGSGATAVASLLTGMGDLRGE